MWSDQGFDTLSPTADLEAPMAFYDDLVRDPKSEKEFWTIIEETFVQVEGALTAYPAETREEALAGTLSAGNFRNTTVSLIRYRGEDKDIDSRDSSNLVFRRLVSQAGLVEALNATSLSDRIAA
jgi:hypothetical protein